MDTEITQEQVEKLYFKLKREAESNGYNLNPDVEFTKELVKGLIVNEQRYGYWSCPCRLASGTKYADLDMVCPCDYREADLADYGACYCALYVSQEVVDGIKKLTSIPDRRPNETLRKSKTVNQKSVNQTENSVLSLPYPVWRCKVCGYLCAKEVPPEICPICKARKDRFEKFL